MCAEPKSWDPENHKLEAENRRLKAAMLDLQQAADKVRVLMENSLSDEQQANNVLRDEIGAMKEQLTEMKTRAERAEQLMSWAASR